MLYERIKLEADERIITTVRKHWWIIFAQTLVVLFLAIVPTAFLQLTLNLDLIGTIINQETLQTFILNHAWEVIFLNAAWLLLLWMTLANFWTDHYLDLWTVTNKRVIAVDQHGFFRRSIGSFRLERLQDMNIEVNGILATLLDYGTIEAQTAGGSEEEFRANYMPRPRELKSLIIKAADDLTGEFRDAIKALSKDEL